MLITEHVKSAYEETAGKDLSKAQQTLAHFAFQRDAANRTLDQQNAKFSAVLVQYGVEAIHWGNLGDALQAQAEAACYKQIEFYSDRQFETAEEALAAMQKICMDQIIHTPFTGGGSSPASNAIEAYRFEAMRRIASQVLAVAR